MQPFFGDVRVSTARQGEHGTALEFQRQAILHLAQAASYPLSTGSRNRVDLGELLDADVMVEMAGENLDLHSRSGRLAADIQAVVAADFIRNLREETR